MEKFTITQNDLDQVVGWWKANRGIMLWRNLELGSSRNDQITPADGDKPHWSMGSVGEIYPHEIKVEFRTPLELPPKWFPKCENCKGTAKRSIQELADIRKETLKETLELTMRSDWRWGPVVDGMFPCNYCNGTGHKVEKIKFRVKHQYWGGYTESASGLAKCKKMADGLAKHYGVTAPEKVEYDWNHIGYGMAEAYFYKVESKMLDEHLADLSAPLAG